MKEYTQTILRNAVIKEKASQKLYKNLANKASNKAIKNIFLQLVEEEKVHENLFKHMDIGLLKKMNKSELDDLNLLKDIKDGKLMIDENDINDINSTLDFAMAQEQKAFDDYMFFSKYMQEGEPKTALVEVAKQEARHKAMLAKVQSDFNAADW